MINVNERPDNLSINVFMCKDPRKSMVIRGSTVGDAVKKAVDRGTSFAGMDLSGYDLSGQTFFMGDFTDADLRHADLSGCVFDDCSFNRAVMDGAKVAGAVFKDCDLRIKPAWKKDGWPDWSSAASIEGCDEPGGGLARRATKTDEPSEAVRPATATANRPDPVSATARPSLSDPLPRSGDGAVVCESSGVDVSRPLPPKPPYDPPAGTAWERYGNRWGLANKGADLPYAVIPLLPESRAIGCMWTLNDKHEWVIAPLPLLPSEAKTAESNREESDWAWSNLPDVPATEDRATKYRDSVSEVWRARHDEWMRLIDGGAKVSWYEYASSFGPTPVAPQGEASDSADSADVPATARPDSADVPEHWVDVEADEVLWVPDGKGDHYRFEYREGLVHSIMHRGKTIVGDEDSEDGFDDMGSPAGPVDYAPSPDEPSPGRTGEVTPSSAIAAIMMTNFGFIWPDMIEVFPRLEGAKYYIMQRVAARMAASEWEE